MACEICGRSACIKSFHSLWQQECFDERENMSDDVNTLRLEIQELREENQELKEKLALQE